MRVARLANFSILTRFLNMKSYFLKRLLAVIPMFFLMTAVYFCIQNYLPGGPVQETLARITGLSGDGGSNRVLSTQDIAELRHELEVQYGLDKPVHERYILWLKKIITLDFGDSITTRAPAMDQIIERLPVSLAFGIPGFFLTYLVCIPLGVLMALKDGTRFDLVSSFILFLVYSIPVLVVSVVCLLVFCTDRVLPGGAIFPLGGLHSDNYDTLSAMGQAWDMTKHLFLPVMASMVGNFTALSLLQKNSMLEVIRSDYMRTAKAKGLHERVILFKHGLRNALLPMLVGIGGLLGVFLGGSIIIEPIFGLPGIGVLSLSALSARDFNVIMAIVVLQSCAILFGQLLSDLAYAIADPRIQFQSRE